MAVIFVKRVGSALLPDGDESIATLDKLPFDRLLKAEVTEPRNIRFHNLFFKLCSRIGSGIGRDAAWVANALKIETGWTDVFEYGGKVHIVPRSIAFHKMDNLQFKEWFEQCVDVIYRVWGVDPASVADLLVPEGEEEMRR